MQRAGLLRFARNDNQKPITSVARMSGAKSGISITFFPGYPQRIIRTPETIAAYLIEAFATHDSAYISAAVDAIARAKGMATAAWASAQQSNSSGGKNL